MAKVTPVNWAPFIEEEMIGKANLVSLGLVNVVNYSFPGKYFPKPVREHYEDIAVMNKVIATTTLTPVTYSDYQENVVVRSVGDAVYETNYDVTKRGENGIDGLARQIVPVVNNFVQDDLVSVATGAFGSALASTHYSDLSGVGDGMPTVNAIEKGLQSLFGEQMNTMDTLIMSSNHYVYLGSKYTIQMVVTDQMNDVTFRGAIPTLGKYKILINDTLCAASGSNYPIFIAGGKPWELYWQKNISLYKDFDALTGGGKDILAWYAHWGPSIRGVSWTHTSYDPTAGDLATSGYWGAVGNAKNTKLVKLLFKGDL